MVDVFQLARENIRQLQPYSSARDEFSGQAKIFLDANENAYGAPLESAENFHRYPDPHQRRLKEALSRLYGLPPEQIFLGNGSDEAIDLLFRVFCRPQTDRVLLTPPTYGMYEVCAQINDVPVEKVPLKPDFSLNLPALQQALRPPVKLMFLCSPNNPTGNAFPRSAVESLLKSFHGILVVDEAYIDFAEEKTVFPLLGKYAHLVILRTFSKAWGSAKIRLGMAFGSPQVISLLNKIKMPYNVSGLTQEAALKLLENKVQRDEQIARILEQRQRLSRELRGFSFVKHVYPSDTNFILLRVTDPKALYRFLMEKGIIVRDRSSVLHCADCLRITVGTEGENDQLLRILSEWEQRT